jgi:lactoylglutathione lyase
MNEILVIVLFATPIATISYRFHVWIGSTHPFSRFSQLGNELFTRINHVGIRVNGKTFSEARAFYEKLGFEWIVDLVGPEPVAIMEHAKSGVTINLILNGNAPEGSPHNILRDDKTGHKYAGHTHIALEVKDLDAVQASLEAEGIKIEERMTLPGNGAALFIRDPDRTTIEFHQPGSKWWEDPAEKEKLEAAAAAAKQTQG